MFLCTGDRFGVKSSSLQVQEIRKGRQETGMAELGPAAQTEEQEENAGAVEGGTGTLGGVQGYC